MNVMGLFAAVYVADIDASAAWYAKLIGRPADHRPMPTLVQWVGVAGAGVQLFHDPDRAGHGRMTIVTPDIEAERGGLAAQGLNLSDTMRGDFGAIAGLEDPDGNLITLAEPPKRG